MTVWKAPWTRLNSIRSSTRSSRSLRSTSSSNLSPDVSLSTDPSRALNVPEGGIVDELVVRQEQHHRRE